MENRIQPDYSIRVTFGEEDEQLVDRRFDHVHLFSWLGHGMLKLVGQDGFSVYHMSEEHARMLAERAGIFPIPREEISKSEYEAYLRYTEQMMENWDDLKGLDEIDE